MVLRAGIFEHLRGAPKGANSAYAWLQPLMHKGLDPPGDLDSEHHELWPAGWRRAGPQRVIGTHLRYAPRNEMCLYRKPLCQRTACLLSGVKRTLFPQPNMSANDP